MSTFADMPGHIPPPRIDRVRHTLRRRLLRVEAAERVTPRMLRIVLSGQDLADFESLAPDDHVKVFVPDGEGGMARRDYTPRRFDAASRRLTLDFALHEAGPATAWALGAKVGDELEVAGPRGSAVVSRDVRRWLLVGDETALPAIGRRLEEAEPNTSITVVALVTDPGERQAFATQASVTTVWVHRPASQAADPGPVLDGLRTLSIAPGTFAWIAAEARVTRAIRAFLVGERGHDLGWLKAAGYWVEGEADAHETFE